ncbi:MAG: ATP-binding cassette domain-containing protein [Candidatus Omnitrophica bacterium]|nr:ATP-binding cassette domain-containing protein [Candidatus Omnitrophota bacterium]
MKNLSVLLQGKTILKDISFEVRAGESLVIAGPSGCGKSVLLKTILGLIEPARGEIFFENKNVQEMSPEERQEFHRKIEMVFQNSALFDSMPVWENVGFSLLYHTSLPEEEIRTKVQEALAAVGLEGIEEKMPEQLSGGMRKRVAIARALISQPQVLFYDEPTTGLDPVTSEQITRLMMKIHSEYGTTDVTVTHDVKLAARIAQRIVLLGNGVIEEMGTFSELKVHSQHPLIRSYLEAFEDNPQLPPIDPPEVKSDPKNNH